MSRRPPFRPSALLWAVLFLLNMAGDGFGIHPCPHHDSPAGHGAAAADVAHAHVADSTASHATTSHHDDHSNHATPALDDASGDASSDSHDGPCTCSGACQAGSAADLPGDAARAPLAAIAAASAALVPATTAPLPSRHPPHFLPWGLAPPAHD